MTEADRDAKIKEVLVSAGLIPEAVEELIIERCRTEPYYREYIEELWEIGGEGEATGTA